MYDAIKEAIINLNSWVSFDIEPLGTIAATQIRGKFSHVANAVSRTSSREILKTNQFDKTFDLPLRSPVVLDPSAVLNSQV